MLALKRTMPLGIVALLTWILLLNVVQVVGASETLPPTLVSPANGAWVTETRPTFKWIFNTFDPDDGQSGFNLQISSQANFSAPINITAISSSQNYTLATNEALEDGMYYWRVRTNNTFGVWSDWSDVWILRVDTTPPNPVSVSLFRTWAELKVEELKIGGGQFFEISWTESNDPYFGRYEVYVSTDPSFLGTKKATITSIESTTCTVGGLDPDTTYYLSVVVVDQAGLSSEAATVMVTTGAPINWPLMGGIAVAIEVAIVAIFIVIKLFVRKK